MSHAEYIGKTSNNPDDAAHTPTPTAQIWCPETSGFPETKITFEREEIQENTIGQLMVIGRTV